MLQSKSLLLATLLAACGDNASTNQPDAKLPADAAVVVTPDATAKPTFLDPATYADVFAIDAGFPFGVVARHTADVGIPGSRWGRHNGPMVTAGDPAIHKWTIPTSATAAATVADSSFTPASGIPTMLFYSADGMVDLFGTSSLLAYSAGGAPFTGEALLYNAAYDTVTSRAYANGFYSGAGVTDGTKQVLVYSGLSPLTAAKSTTSDNGLYAAPICNSKLLDASCAASAKLFSWAGYSGPVVADASGNVFVAESLMGGATSDAVYAITKAQALAATAVTPVDLAEVNSGGTASLAAVAPTATAPGWVLGIGFDASAGVYAASYTSALAKGTASITKAIAPTAAVTAVSMFTDPTGDLWLAVTTDTAGYYFELVRKD